jgi:hypothetical protein
MTPTGLPPSFWLDRLAEIAAKHHDGHFTVMKFTTNWRVGFGTLTAAFEINRMAVAKTFEEAAARAIAIYEDD